VLAAGGTGDAGRADGMPGAAADGVTLPVAGKFPLGLTPTVLLVVATLAGCAGPWISAGDGAGGGTAAAAETGVPAASDAPAPGAGAAVRVGSLAAIPGPARDADGRGALAVCGLADSRLAASAGVGGAAAARLSARGSVRLASRGRLATRSPDAAFEPGAVNSGAGAGDMVSTAAVAVVSAAEGAFPVGAVLAAGAGADGMPGIAAPPRNHQMAPLTATTTAASAALGRTLDGTSAAVGGSIFLGAAPSAAGTRWTVEMVAGRPPGASRKRRT